MVAVVAHRNARHGGQRLWGVYGNWQGSSAEAAGFDQSTPAGADCLPASNCRVLAGSLTLAKHLEVLLRMLPAAFGQPIAGEWISRLGAEGRHFLFDALRDLAF